MTRGRWAAGLALAAAAAAAVIALTVSLRAGSPIVTHGARDRPWVALTFDADMTVSMLERVRAGRMAAFDPVIVRELRAQSARATIFLTGLWVQAYPDVARSLAQSPLFELENHSLDHAAFQAPCFGLATVETVVDKRAEVLRAATTITRVVGIAPHYFRFPGGCHDDGDLALVRSLGHEPVQWDTVSGDSFESDPDAVVRNVMSAVRPGSIVVMHLNGAPNAPATARALKRLIPLLRQRGLRLVTLRELLAPR